MSRTRWFRLMMPALALIVAFMAAEVIAGVAAHSLALISDAAHMLTDAASIALVLVTARLAARTSAISTGSPWLDRLLAGPGFLDAGAFPEISFRSELLAWVPAGWRAVGRLQVKNAELNWPANSLCTWAARGRTAPRASSSPAAGSSTPGG